MALVEIALAGNDSKCTITEILITVKLHGRTVAMNNIMAIFRVKFSFLNDDRGSKVLNFLAK